MATWICSPIPWLLLGALASAFAAVLTVRQQDVQARDVEGWLTGGDSYGYVEPLFDRRSPGSVTYFLRFSGRRYPVYDVTVRVQDAQGRDIQGVQAFGTLTANSQWYDVAGLDFAAASPSDGPQDRRIEIIARNGVTVQRLRLQPSSGRWLQDSADIKPNLREAWVGDILSPKDFPPATLQP